MKIYVVDTHALAWYLDDDPRLGSQAELVLDNDDVRLIIPAIVLAEIKYLAHKNRLP
jgi:PIN domain nuclease of toxin-antitoxin system